MTNWRPYKYVGISRQDYATVFQQDVVWKRLELLLLQDILKQVPECYVENIRLYIFHSEMPVKTLEGLFILSFLWLLFSFMKIFTFIKIWLWRFTLIKVKAKIYVHSKKSGIIFFINICLNRSNGCLIVGGGFFKTRPQKVYS